jgi:uncharacterized protein YndB with AHSA1/START domain
MPPKPPPIEWRLHLKISPEIVFDYWATDRGRQLFWSEESFAGPSGFTIRFVNGQSFDVELVESRRPELFAFRYFGGSRVTILLAPDGSGGCDLHLIEEQIPPEEYCENRAGWVSVLLALKAAADFGVDLRGHDPERSWDQGYADN